MGWIVASDEGQEYLKKASGWTGTKTSHASGLQFMRKWTSDPAKAEIFAVYDEAANAAAMASASQKACSVKPEDALPAIKSSQ